MGRALDRDSLLAAFDEIGRCAAAAGAKLEIAVYGGSALMLASNFRYATEDVDVSLLDLPGPDWLGSAIERIAVANDWAADWLDNAVVFHLSALADHAVDHLEFGTFPRDGGPVGLVVHVPTAPYLLALKLKAIRINDQVRGEQERLDILNLMRVVGIRSVDDAVAVMGRYFPISAAAAEKQSNGSCSRTCNLKERGMRPNTLAEAIERVRGGEPYEVALAEFVDSFLVAPDGDARYAAIESSPPLCGDARIDALAGAIAEYLAKQHRLGRVPGWTSAPCRRLDEPWLTTSSTSPGMREYLTFSSPAEFRSRNIFTEERPLRRARSAAAAAPMTVTGRA